MLGDMIFLLSGTRSMRTGNCQDTSLQLVTWRKSLSYPRRRDENRGRDGVRHEKQTGTTNSTEEDEGDISRRKTEGKRRMTNCRTWRQPRYQNNGSGFFHNESWEIMSCRRRASEMRRWKGRNGFSPVPSVRLSAQLRKKMLFHFLLQRSWRRRSSSGNFRYRIEKRILTPQGNFR